MMTRKRKSLSNSAPDAAATTPNDGEKETAAPVITPEFRLANHVLLSKEIGGCKNVAFSPLCIKLLLSIAAAGCNGPVCEQLLSFLRSQSINDLNSVATQLFSSVLVDRSSSGGPHLSFANGVWVDKTLSFKPSFSQVLENTYNPTFASLDFTNKDEVAKEINSWVERETKGVIKNFIEPSSIGLTVVLIMANTLYFKGLWRDSDTFRKRDTRDGDFHLLHGGGSVKVPFMDGSHHRSAIAHHYQDFKVLNLHYKEASENVPRRRYTLHIFLPDEINGLLALVEKVCSEYASLGSMLPFSFVGLGKLKIPRFKLSFMVEASSMLKEMGLVLPFMEGAFTEMVEERAVHISQIMQKCIIEVNEEGTEAAAATLTYSPTGSTMNTPPPFDFIADHPFLFMIREEYTGTVLFVGQVLNPLES